MKRRSETFELVLLGCAALLAVTLHAIYDDLLKAIFIKWIGRIFNVEEATFIGRLSELALPLVLSIAIVWFVYRYTKQQLTNEQVDPVVDAQRRHTEAIEAQTAALEVRQSPIVTSAGPSWTDLEKRFTELEAALQFSRIDGQTGAAGEFWRMAGGAGSDAEGRFNAVAAMAGAKLFREFPAEVNRHVQLSVESDATTRWYKALQYIGGRYESSGQIVQQLNDDGSSAGYIYTGTIYRPASASATLCLTLASRQTS